MAGGTRRWSHTIRLEATPISASEARTFVLHHLAAHRLEHLAEPLRLAVSELATNAIAHARTTFSVTLAADERCVVLTVRDDADRLPARRDAQVMDLGGRGLQLVEVLSTGWGVNKDEDGSKAVWASFALG